MNEIAVHPMQSEEWGEARKKMGIRVEKIIENDSVFQFTIHHIPHTPFSIGYLPRSVMPTENVLRQLSDFGKKNNLLFIKIEPYISQDESCKLQATSFSNLLTPFSPNGHRLLI